MRHPLTQIGATAAMVLLDRLDAAEEAAKNADSDLSGVRISLRGELIVRGSTAAPHF